MILNNLIKISKKKLIIPFYHAVENTASDFVKNLYSPRKIKDFETDLNVFLSYYKPISLNELIKIKQSKYKIKSPCFHLTFDDGLANFYHEIAPILLEKKIPATIFINSNFVDNRELFYRYKASLLIENYDGSNKKESYHQFINHYKKENFNQNNSSKKKIVKQFLLTINFQNKDLLDDLAKQVNFSFSKFLEVKKPYLTLKQIKKLQKKGFTFGAHSMSHPNYAELTLEKQLEQTISSVNWIKTNLDPKFDTFSFPFSDIGVSNSFFKEIKPIVDLSFGTSGIKKSKYPFHLQRLDMEKNKTDTKSFLLKVYLKSLINFVA